MTGTQAIDRAAQLLVLVVENESSSSVGELAEAAGLPKSTVSRAVSALERQGLVQRSSARGSIRPGPVLLGLARRGVGERGHRRAVPRSARQPGRRHRRDHRPGGGRARRRRAATSPRSTAATSWAPPTGSDGGCPTTAPRSARCWSRSARRASSGARWSGSPPTPSPTATRCQQHWIRCGHADMRPRWASWSRAWWPLRRRCLMPTAGPWRRSASRGPQFRISSDRLDGFGKLLTKETDTLSARLGYRPAGEGAA